LRELFNVFGRLGETGFVIAPTAKETIGVPHAVLSCKASGKLSARVGNAKTPAAL
jgi:hypothetical protein